jgi:hypothetical protein
VYVRNMKPLRLWMLLAASVFLMGTASCVKKAPAASAGPETRAVLFIVMQGAALYVDNGTADRPKLELKQELDFGTYARLTAGNSPKRFVVGGKTMALLAVEVGMAGGMAEGWVQPADLAGGNVEPAVVKDAEVSLLKVPSADAAVLLRLHRMDLVAAVRGNADAEFVTVTAVAPLRKIPSPQAFIDRRSLSFSMVDVGAATQVEAAAGARTPEEAQSFLKDAEQHYSDTLFIDDIRARLGPAAAPVGVVTVPVAAVFKVNIDGPPFERRHLRAPGRLLR